MHANLVNFGISAAGATPFLVLVPSPVGIGSAFIVPLLVFWVRRQQHERKSVVIAKGAAAGVAVTLLGAFLLGAIIELTHHSPAAAARMAESAASGSAGSIAISLAIFLVAGGIAVLRGPRPCATRQRYDRRRYDRRRHDRRRHDRRRAGP